MKESTASRRFLLFLRCRKEIDSFEYLGYWDAILRFPAKPIIFNCLDRNFSEAERIVGKYLTLCNDIFDGIDSLEEKNWIGYSE